ncbi:sensor domain-containing protein [Alkalibacillus silvisoli]|uniref:Diguanylate cyclase n=1 Tax=Alkalibacillus silvisoli TaxID=392823 RepID=A0ABP3JGP4_9BACI
MISNQLYNQVLMSGLDSMVFVMRVEEEYNFYYEFLNDLAMDKANLTGEVIGKELRDVLSYEQSVYLHKKYTEAVKANSAITYEDLFHSNSKNGYITETKLTPLFNEQGNCSHIVAVVRDITDVKKAEKTREDSKKRLETSKQRYKSLFLENADAIFSVDYNGRLVELNNAFELLFGYKREDLINQVAFKFVNSQLKRKLKKHFVQTLRKEPQNFEVNTHNGNGDEMDLDVTMTPIVMEGKVTGVYVIIKDMTEQRNAERTLSKNEERFRMIAESSHDLITLVDGQGVISYASPSYRHVLGYFPEHYIGQSLLHNLHEEDFNTVLDAFERAKELGSPISLEFRQYHQEKEWLWFELQAKPIYADDGQFHQMVVVTRNISERKAYEEQLKLFAYHDPLTELPNRRLFQSNLIKHIADYQKGEKGFAVMMLDIDNFKSINDEFGHDIGDQVIKEFGRRIQDSLRESDFVARLGGDEFIALLTNINSKQDALEVIHRIQRVIEDEWDVSGEELEVTTSIGVALPDSSMVSDEELIKFADSALYEAKSSGKDTYQLTTIV